MSTSEVNLFSADIKFKDVIRHFRKMSREQIADDIEKTLDDLENLELDGDSFGSFMVKTAFNAREKRKESTAEFGKLGGRPKKNETSETSTEVAPVNASKRNDQLIWGRFENVYLSQEEYNTLAADFGNINYLNNVIESLSASIADGKTISQNHFATLTRWIAWRKAQEEKEQSGERRATFKEVEAEREIEQLKRFGVIK